MEPRSYRSVIEARPMTEPPLQLAPALIVALLAASSAGAHDWNDLRPAVTTEREIVSWFGEPTAVIATFPWAQWNAKWKRRPETASYRLRYEVGSSASSLLLGPGGKAEEVEVTIRKGKLGAVRWRYGGPSARSAAAQLRGTPEFAVRPRDSGAVGARSVDGGWLAAEIGEGDSVVEITLQLK
jgi:hypothetical protein